MRISKELESALREAQEALAQRDKIKKLVAADRQRLQEAQRELQQGLQSLGAAEADALIKGAASNAGSSLKRHRALRDEIDTLDARIVGLQTKLLQLEDIIVQKADALTAARSEFAHAQLEEFSGRYDQAARDFINVAREGALLGQVFGSDLPGLLTAVPNLFRPGNVAGVAENRLAANGVWERSIPTSPEIEALVPVQRACETVDRESQSIRRVRTEQQRLERERQREAEQAQQPVYAAARSLPVSAGQAAVLEAQERADQELRDRARATQAQVSTAVMYPHDPKRHGSFTLAKIFPSGFVKQS